MVVNREKEIKGFKSAKYYELKGIFEKDGIPFKTTLKPADNLPLDEENRIKDKNILQAIKLKIEKAEVVIKDMQGKDMVQHHSLRVQTKIVRLLNGLTEQLAPQGVKEITTKVLTEFGLVAKLKATKFSYKGLKR